MLDLETHWTMEKRPALVFSTDTAAMERSHDELLEKYPLPEGWGDQYLDEPKGKKKGGAAVKVL